jgi:Tfp pilus assembly protein PilN
MPNILRLLLKYLIGGAFLLSILLFVILPLEFLAWIFKEERR